MTVIELIEALVELGDDAQGLEVQTEGCDCWGDACSVKIKYPGCADEFVYIART